MHILQIIATVAEVLKDDEQSKEFFDSFTKEIDDKELYRIVIEILEYLAKKTTNNIDDSIVYMMKSLIIQND